MSQHKTFKEEIKERLKVELFSVRAAVNSVHISEHDSINRFVESALDPYKQKILEALPKEQVECRCPTYKEHVAHNKCLSEVKQIIENI